MDTFDLDKRLFALTKCLYSGLHYRSLLRPELESRGRFYSDFAALYPTISREDVTDLLSWEDWRPRLVGAYICGFRGWDEFEGCVGRLLVRDELIFSSVAYSFALARFASPAASTSLCSYLWNNFSGRCTDYSSIWHAVAALKWIDAQNRTDFYERNVGEWHEKIESGRATLTNTSKEESRDLMRRALCDERVEDAEEELAKLLSLRCEI